MILRAFAMSVSSEEGLIMLWGWASRPEEVETVSGPGVRYRHCLHMAVSYILTAITGPLALGQSMSGTLGRQIGGDFPAVLHSNALFRVSWLVGLRDIGHLTLQPKHGGG